MILLEHQTDKINRQVQFMYAQAFDAEEITGKNNTWLYDRAPEGYKFILHSAEISSEQYATAKYGVVAIYDGHEYTHWNQYPGVESKELLGRVQMNDYIINNSIPLNNWECKEYTIGIRSTHVTFAFKICIIIWYSLRKMSWLEKLQYAVIQPRGQRYRKSGPTTVERTERYGW